jgi:hypothetical protein
MRVGVVEMRLFSVRCVIFLSAWTRTSGAVTSISMKLAKIALRLIAGIALKVIAEACPVVAVLTTEVADAGFADPELVGQVLRAVIQGHVVDDATVSVCPGRQPCGKVQAKADLIEHRRVGVVPEDFFVGVPVPFTLNAGVNSFMGPAGGDGQVRNAEAMFQLGLAAEDIPGWFLTAEPTPALDSPDREGGKGGREHGRVFSPLDQPGIPAEGKGDGFLNEIGFALGASESTEVNSCLDFEAGQEQEKSIVQGG